MTSANVSDPTFQILLSSARLGSRLDLSSSQFRLSIEQLEQLLVASARSQKGQIITRGEDYELLSLTILSLRYGPNLDVVWLNPLQPC